VAQYVVDEMREMTKLPEWNDRPTDEEAFLEIRDMNHALNERARREALAREIHFNVAERFIIRMQALVRMKLAKLKSARKKVKVINATIRISATWRMRIQRKKYLTQRTGMNLRKTTGGIKCIMNAKKKILRKRYAARTIQRYWRSMRWYSLIRNTSEEGKWAVEKVQAAFRARKIRNKFQALLRQRTKAAAKIQGLARGHAARKEYTMILTAIIKIQRAFRDAIAYRYKKQLRIHAIEMEKQQLEDQKRQAAAQNGEEYENKSENAAESEPMNDPEQDAKDEAAMHQLQKAMSHKHL